MVQLSVLGYILVPIFNVTTWWPVLLYAAFMVLISALEAMGRPAKVYNGMFLHVLLSIAVVASAVMAYGLLLVIGVAPWWEVGTRTLRLACSATHQQTSSSRRPGCCAPSCAAFMSLTRSKLTVWCCARHTNMQRMLQCSRNT